MPLVTPTPSAKQVLIMVAVGFIALALIFHNLSNWWETRQAVNEAKAPLEGKIEATAGINASGAIADEERTTDDQTATQAAETFRTTIARSHTHDPIARDRASRPVPDSVRQAFRARRLAIERSGCTGAECDEAAAEADPAER